MDMETQDRLMLGPPPTPGRPLLGVTVLLVEDSRFAAEGVRLLCLRSGARIRRADSLTSARKHLRVYRPTVVLVDMTLSDGSGAVLIGELAQGTPRIEAILAMSGDPATEALALRSGADGFLPKPVETLARFQAAVLAHLPKDRQPKGLRVLSDERVAPDHVAYRDDLSHALDLLERGEDATRIRYLTQFLAGVARSAGDEPLGAAVTALAACHGAGAPQGGAFDHVARLVRTRIEESSPLLG